LEAVESSYSKIFFELECTKVTRESAKLVPLLSPSYRFSIYQQKFISLAKGHLQRQRALLSEVIIEVVVEL
jgi:hypothetical protein